MSEEELKKEETEDLRAQRIAEDEETERQKAEEARKKRKWIRIAVSVAALGVIIVLVLALNWIGVALYYFWLRKAVN